MIALDTVENTTRCETSPTDLPGNTMTDKWQADLLDHTESSYLRSATARLLCGWVQSVGEGVLPTARGIKELSVVLGET